MTKELVGKKVIVRGYASGVFFGTVKALAKDGQYASVHLGDARRIWYWTGAASLSQLAKSGVTNPGQSKFSVTVKNQYIFDCCEIIECEPEGIENIESVSEWKS